MSSSKIYTREQLGRYGTSYLKRICTAKKIKGCKDKKKSEIIEKILADQGVIEPAIKVVGGMMVIEENLQSKKVSQLKAIARKEGIKLSPRDRKTDIIRKIQDARAIGYEEEEIVIKPMINKRELEKKNVKLLRKMCKDRGINLCTESSKYIKKGTLIDLLSQVEGEEVLPVIPEKEELEEMKVSELRELCGDVGLPKRICNKPKKALVKELSKEPIPIPVGDKNFLCGSSLTERVCPKEKVCDVYTGKCLAKTKTGKLYGRASKTRQTEYGDDYYFNEEYGLVGRKQDVMNHLNYWGVGKKIPSPKRVAVKKRSPLSWKGEEVSPRSWKIVKKPSPPKTKEIIGKALPLLPERKELPKRRKVPRKVPSKRKRIYGKAPSKRKRIYGKAPSKRKKVTTQRLKCYEEGGECKEDQLCKHTTGRCVKDIERNRKKGDYMLSINGRKIIGTKSAILNLKESLGGDISIIGEELKLPSIEEEEEEVEVEPVSEEETETMSEEEEKEIQPVSEEETISEEEEEEIQPVFEKEKQLEASKEQIKQAFVKCLSTISSK